MFRITPSSLLTSAGQVVLTLVLGFFMLLSIAVVATKMVEVKETRIRVHQIDKESMGRLHIFDARDHSQVAFGVPVKCWAYVTNGQTKVYYASDANAFSYCAEHFLPNMKNWQDYRPNNRSNPLMVLVVLIVVGLSALLVVRMVAGVLALMFDVVSEKSLTVFSLLVGMPLFIGALVFVLGMSFNTSKVWTAPTEYPVKTYPVYRSQGGEFYIAPETTYEWTDPMVGTKISP